METRRDRQAADGAVPVLLTVEEAADILRVGRTKAYRMAAEWRTTDGRSGLPVLDFGNVLRVPRHALERMVGGELRGRVSQRADDDSTVTGPEPRPAPRRRPTRRPRSASPSQLDLFDPTRTS